MASGVGTQRSAATVLFADVHAFSVHMAKDETGTYARLVKARELFA